MYRDLCKAFIQKTCTTVRDKIARAARSRTRAWGAGQPGKNICNDDILHAIWGMYIAL
jgi:hypothetical protein